MVRGGGTFSQSLLYTRKVVIEVLFGHARVVALTSSTSLATGGRSLLPAAHLDYFGPQTRTTRDTTARAT